MTHEDKVAGMRRNLEAKTGRSVDGWIRALAEAGLTDDAAARAWLKTQGVGHFQIRLVLTDRAPRT
jgi:hypothetical protein